MGQSLPIDDFDDPNIDPTAFVLDESVYPEVRSAVANTDDPSMPSSTFRAWVVGVMWAIIIPGVSQFFSMRYPTVVIYQVCPFLPFRPSRSFFVHLAESKSSATTRLFPNF
jgi:hypothetical protein